MTSQTRVFLYGTLRAADHLAAVLGHAEAGLRAGVLDGHAVYWDRDGQIPVLVEEAGAAAAGFLMDAGPEDVARFDFYEGAFGYRRRTVSVGGEPAECYFPPNPAIAGTEPFELDDWVDRYGDLAVAGAAEAMALFGQVPAAEMAGSYRGIYGRGWSRVLAGRGRSESRVRTGAGRGAVREIERCRVYTGFFALDRLRLSHPTFAGGDLTVTREVFRSIDAALVLPYDPGRDTVALVEQFRVAPYVRGENQPWVLEPVAGLIDPGESPEDCARRESLEETGLELGTLVPAASGYPSPGATTEFFHLFVGIADLDPSPGRSGGGVVDEGEDIRTHFLPLDEALALIPTGEANVLPLVLLLNWAAAHRTELAALA